MPPVVAFLSFFAIATLLLTASLLVDAPLNMLLGSVGLLVGLVGVGVLLWYNARKTRG